MTQKDKILKMISENKITVEEGEKLLRAMGEDDEVETQVVKKENPSEFKINSKINNLKGKLIIEVESADGDNVKVNLPLKLAKLAVTMIPGDKISLMQAEGVNLKEIMDNISDIVEEIDGDIVNIESANGDHVRIYIVKK